MKKLAVLLAAMLLLSCPVQAAEPSVSARSAVLINGNTGRIIWGHNENEKRSMASTTKIMTALLLAEEGNLDRKIVTTKEMVTVEGSSMGLMAGDTVSYRDLLYGMLLASGNDAANTAAIVVSGSTQAFADKMNEKAEKLGLTGTHFVTPSGLDSEEHYSTAYDMAILARAALQNKDFSDAAKSRTKTLCYGNPPYKRSLKNHNRLLDSYEGLIGVKTGFTKKSGRCLVTAAQRGTAYVIAVTLCDPNDWDDHAQLLDYGFSVLETKEADVPTEIGLVSVVGGENDEIKVTPEKPTLSLTAEEWQRLEKKIILPRFVYAKVTAGQRVGYVEYSLDGVAVTKTDIVAANGVKRQKPESIKDGILSRFMTLIKAML